MFKIILTIFVFCTSLYSTSLKNKYTIALAYMKNITNINNITSNYLIKKEKSVFVINYKEGFLVTYGVFDNPDDANNFKNGLSSKIKSLNPYIKKFKSNFLEENNLTEDKTKNKKIIENTKKTTQKKHTIVLAYMKKLSSMETLVSEYLDNKREGLSYIKYKEGYLITYGAFNNKIDAMNFKENLSTRIKSLKPYIKKIESNFLKKVDFKDNQTEIKEIVLTKENRLKNKHTLVLGYMKQLPSIKKFVLKYINKRTVPTSYIKYKEGYALIYGLFDTKKETYDFKDTLSSEIKDLKPYILTLDYNNLKTKVILPKVKIKKNKPKKVKVSNKKIKLDNQKLKKEVEKLKKVVIELQKRETKKAIDNKILKRKKEIIKEKEIAVIKKEKVIIKKDEKKNEKKIKPETLEKKSNTLFDNISVSFEYSPLSIDSVFSHAGKDKVDFENDLGLKGYDQVLTPEISIPVKYGELYGSYAYLNRNNSKNITKDLEINNYTFRNGEKLDTKYSVSWLTLGYKHNINDNIKMGLDYHNYIDKTEIVSVSNKMNLEKAFYFPSVSINLNNEIKNFNLLYGGSYGGKSNVLEYYKYFISLKTNDLIFKKTNLLLGYKNQTLRIKSNDYSGNTEYSGIYLKLEKIF